MSIALRIALIRGEMSRSGFAKRLNTRENTLRNYEKGLSLPNSDMLLRICEAFQINPVWLLLGEGDMHVPNWDSQTWPASVGGQQALTEADGLRCTKLERKLEVLEQERREQAAELREVNAQNRLLWQENSMLKDKCFRLEKQVSGVDNAPLLPVKKQFLSCNKGGVDCE